jgi:hypothetical protein
VQQKASAAVLKIVVEARRTYFAAIMAGRYPAGGPGYRTAPKDFARSALGERPGARGTSSARDGPVPKRNLRP